MAQRLSTCHTNVSPGIQIPELTWNVKYQVGMAAHSIYLRWQAWGVHRTSWLAKWAISARCGFAWETLHEWIRRGWPSMILDVNLRPHALVHTQTHTHMHTYVKIYIHTMHTTPLGGKNTWWNLSQESNNYGLLKVSFKSSVVSQCSSYALFTSSMYITKEDKLGFCPSGLCFTRV